MQSIISLSGGMDSATVLAWLLARGDAVTAVSFHYGSKHNSHEALAAQQFVDHYQRLPGVGSRLSHIKMDLSHVFAFFRSNLLQSGGEIPEGHYADENMKLTVVPGRNLIFLAILAGLAETVGAGEIGIGIHQGDHAIYPDCRPEFFRAADATIRRSTEGKVSLRAPFLKTDKEGILLWGFQHGVPYHLTRTCYKDQPLPCGKCGSCVERLEAFQKMGIPDPVQYEV